MQKITIIGNIGSDAEVREVNTKSVINFRVACNERTKQENGEWTDKTTWYSCAIWRDKGQSVDVVKYLKKGVKVYVEGFPVASMYKKTDGSNQTMVDNKITIRSLMDMKILTFVKDETGISQGEPANVIPVTSGGDFTGTIPAGDDDLSF